MAVSLAALVLVLALAVAGAVHATSLHAAPAATPACSANTTVQTDKGSVCGVTTDGVTTYFSVPYAAAPVGALRWRPPQPHAPWSGVLASTQEAVECTNVFAQFTQANSSEDCLNLKIMVPAGTPAGAKLPVMFEFHGGGFLGEARTDDGSNLVHTGNVVYVYVNYRLGILGFLADKALGPHSGDYGLQDQQAGLRWVKQNISQFGGDPGNVPVLETRPAAPALCPGRLADRQWAVPEGDQHQRLLQLPEQHRLVEGRLQVALFHRGAGPAGRSPVDGEVGGGHAQMSPPACARFRPGRCLPTAGRSAIPRRAGRLGRSSTAPR